MVVFILIMTVFVPFGCFYMQFNRPCKNCLTNLYASIDKVGSLVFIKLPRVKQYNIFPFSCLQLTLAKVLKLPDELKQLFGHFTR